MNIAILIPLNDSDSITVPLMILLVLWTDIVFSSNVILVHNSFSDDDIF